MEITLGLVVISVIFLVSLCLIGYCLCESEEGYLAIGVIGLVIVLVSTGIRSENIDGNKEELIQKQKYELCVKEGKEVQEIFGTKVCVL